MAPVEEIDSRRDFQLYMRFSVMIYFLLVMSARCPGGRNTLLRAMSDPDFQYTAKSKKPLYIYISVRDFHSLVKITRFSVIRDFHSLVEEIECQRFS